MVAAVIVAAGQGARMGMPVDKLFLEIAGRPVVAHTWQRFNSCSSIAEIVLVVREGHRSAFSDLAQRYQFQKPYRLVGGGKERQDSVWQGLQALGPAVDLVAIQDGARPCTPESVIEATISAARETGAAVAAQRLTDTIKEADQRQCAVRTLDRNKLWAVQTPQTFRLPIIRKALQAARGQGVAVADDAAACELIGQPVKLVESKLPNPKITTPADLEYIEWLLSRSP